MKILKRFIKNFLMVLAVILITCIFGLVAISPFLIYSATGQVRWIGLYFILVPAGVGLYATVNGEDL